MVCEHEYMNIRPPPPPPPPINNAGYATEFQKYIAKLECEISFVINVIFRNRRESYKDIFNQQNRVHFGGCGHQTRYLEHVKRAFYHLS